MVERKRAPVCRDEILKPLVITILLCICADVLFVSSAGKFFQEFEIPAEYENLWRYMHHMYLLDAFTQSCPADQDIINHYKLQQVSARHLTDGAG